MVEYHINGNEHLSCLDVRLHNLVFHILQKWNTLCFVKFSRENVPAYVPGLLQVFVPADSTYRYEIVKFLESELADDVVPPYDMGFPDGSGKLPGRRVQVLLFDGANVYLEKEKLEKILKEAWKSIRQTIRKEYGKGGIRGQSQ